LKIRQLISKNTMTIKTLNQTLEKISVFLEKSSLNARNKAVFTSKLNTELSKHIKKVFERPA